MANDHSKGVAAAKLLEMTPDENYVKEWTKLLASEREKFKTHEEIPFVIFRIGEEWLALTVTVIKRVIQTRKIHKIPHRHTETLLGLVNFEGQLALCMSLQNMLTIKQKIEDASLHQYQRMLCLQQGKEMWVFPVDEVYGIYHCAVEAMEKVPVTLAKSSANFLKGLFKWNKKIVGYLDEELLIRCLRRDSSGKT